MNGSIAFARTLRALDQDGFRTSKLALLAVAALLAAWTWWMLSPRIPQFETAQGVRIDSGSLRAVAQFPMSDLARIHAGQSAELRMDQRSIRAEVVGIAPDGRVELKILEPPVPGPQPREATASIEIDRVSPLTIALRATGRARR